MIHGDNIIYHYLQKSLLSEDDDFSKKLIEKLVIDLSIWIPTSVYNEVPLLIPYVIRDASCRQKQQNGKHEWGFANQKGLLRDDNSLIKGIIKPLKVKSSFKEYNGKKLDVGFVASHIWRKLNDRDILASTFEKTNTFIPNLVWLPKQISKLTDREGSYAQRVLQSLSFKIYFSSNPNNFRKSIWNHLDIPNIPIVDSIDVTKLNYFDAPQLWIDKKKSNLKKEIETIINTIDLNSINGKKIKCSSYLPSLLVRIDNNEKQIFKDWLHLNLAELNN